MSRRNIAADDGVQAGIGKGQTIALGSGETKKKGCC